MACEKIFQKGLLRLSSKVNAMADKYKERKSLAKSKSLAVKGQAFSLLGRLEGLGTGAAALGRRSFAAHQEEMWSRQRQAHALFIKQGRDLLRRGQFYMN